jgi:flagellar biosynthesis protein FlhF
MRSFRAASMQAALALVKEQLGPHATILATRRRVGPDGQPGFEIDATAAEDAAKPRAVVRVAAPARRPASRETDSGPEPADSDPLITQLIQQDIAAALAQRLLAAARAEAGAAADPDLLRQRLARYIARSVPAAGGIALADGQPTRVALVGPPGAGKTTTLAKLAAHFKLRDGRRVGLLSLDLQRLAAHEQLRRYAEIIGIPLAVAQTVGEVKDAFAGDAPEVLLIDTPGVGPRETARFVRLAALLRAARPTEVHLVLPASLDGPVQSRLAQLFAPLGVSRLLLTRLDEALGFGVVLNVVERLGCRLSYWTTGQRVPNDIEVACGERVAELVLAP